MKNTIESVSSEIIDKTVCRVIIHTKWHMTFTDDKREFNLWVNKAGVIKFLEKYKRSSKTRTARSVDEMFSRLKYEIKNSW